MNPNEVGHNEPQRSGSGAMNPTGEAVTYPISEEGDLGDLVCEWQISVTLF